MGKIWFYMISIGIVGSIITNNLGELNKVILNEASRGVEFAISLAGVMALWMGIMNIANGATAFGLKAMEELQTLNNKKDTATNDMIMFLVINISSIQIIPFTMLKIRLDMGAQTPSDIILTTLFATTMSTIIAVISCKLLQGRNR